LRQHRESPASEDIAAGRGNGKEHILHPPECIFKILERLELSATPAKEHPRIVIEAQESHAIGTGDRDQSRRTDDLPPMPNNPTGQSSPKPNHADASML
jgi:hypothetical protein